MIVGGRRTIKEADREGGIVEVENTGITVTYTSFYQKGKGTEVECRKDAYILSGIAAVRIRF
jgi:hypothetical protein